SVRSGVGNIWMVSPGGGTPRPVTTGSGRALSPSVSPDGTSLLVETERVVSDAWEYDLATGAGHALTTIGGAWAPSRLADARLLFCRTSPEGKSSVLLMPIGGGAPATLFTGDATATRAGDGAAVFRGCVPGAACGIFAVPYAGGAPRLLVPDGRWPALSSDR